MKRKCILMMIVTDMVIYSCGKKDVPSAPQIGRLPIRQALESEVDTYEGEIGSSSEYCII